MGEEGTRKRGWDDIFMASYATVRSVKSRRALSQGAAASDL